MNGEPGDRFVYPVHPLHTGGGVQGAWFGLDFIFQGLNACAIIIIFLISMILLRLPPPC